MNLLPNHNQNLVGVDNDDNFVPVTDWLTSGRSTRIARADAAAWARNLPSRGAARAVGAE